MNRILDKFGIYDLVAVLMSGISIYTFSLLVLQFVYKIQIDMELHVNETLSFLVISYFLGLSFQECGSLIHNKIIYKNNPLLNKVLSTSEKSRTSLSETEKTGIYNYVKSKLNIEDDNDYIVYNYCKFYVMEKCNATKIDKEQSLSAMSRSLSLYFTILTLIALISAFIKPNYLNVILVFLSTFLSILFYYRCIRFAKLRYIYTFRIFYYDIIIK